MSTAESVPAQPGQPERKMWNGSAWVALAFAVVAFGANLLFGWSWTIFAAAFGVAFSVTGIVRVYRRRADNGPVAYTALGLALATIALSFVWSARAEPCLPLRNDEARYGQCLEDHVGLL
jgi:ABC-type Fe3+-siderophore transport system permease subunit